MRYRSVVSPFLMILFRQSDVMTMTIEVRRMPGSGKTKPAPEAVRVAG